MSIIRDHEGVAFCKCIRKEKNRIISGGAWRVIAPG
ncbi:hypothetical protein BT93_D1938 [Corymbia citriodora subsp. variegata]|nr:hypothetical protein BT93_D1938 [Corymbia citriodora subsp. variegata]